MRTNYKGLLILFLLFTTSCLSTEKETLVVKSQMLELHKDNLYYLKTKAQPFNGICIDSFPNGQIRQKITYRNGKEDGESIVWFENGVYRETGTFVDGKREGVHTGWCDCGFKLHEIEYKNGIREGLTIKYDQSTGDLLLKIPYKNGKRNGTQTMFNPDSTIKSQTEFKDDEQIGEPVFNKPEKTLIVDSGK